MSWQRTLAATAHITMHPAQLVGKQRPMTDYRNHRTYTPTKTLKAEKAIKDAFRAAYGETFADHDGPVVMRISTTRPPSRTIRRSIREPSPSGQEAHTAHSRA